MGPSLVFRSKRPTNCKKNLQKHLIKFNILKATACFNKHWSFVPSKIIVPRSNQCAERAIKVMEELASNTKRSDYLNIKFIGRNGNL